LRPGPNGQFEEIHLSARLRRQKLDGVSWRYSDNVISLLARLGEHGQLEAMSLLGDAYGHGNGVTQDDRLALKWYQKAAAAGDAQAMYNAGLMYESGKGAPRDLKQARDWYQKSADAGNESARERLAELNRAGGQ
jgi:TPR repeat protein